MVLIKKKKKIFPLSWILFYGLEKYCTWSSQFISIEKSGVFPSTGVSIKFLCQVKSYWGLNSLPQSTTYLGVSLFLSKNESYDLKLVKERLESKLSS